MDEENLITIVIDSPLGKLDRNYFDVELGIGKRILIMKNPSIV